ncbi:MAG: hypothetical protein ACTIJ9_07800 [Aequorivita sp.]
MKNVLILFMALAAFGMNAQNKKFEKRAAQNEMKSNLTQEQRVDLRLKKMTSTLDLTSDQQAQMKKLFLEKGNNRSGMHKNRNEMTKSEIIEAKKAMQARRVSFREEMMEILTKEQVAKWEGQKGKRHNNSRRKMINKKKLQH